MKVLRGKRKDGEQPIDWVDVNWLAGVLNPWTYIHADFGTKVFDWNGIPDLFGSSAPQAEGRDVFQGVSASATRIFPAVTVEHPVPPPFVTAVAKIIYNASGALVCEARRRVFIPQVVKLQYDQASVDAFLEGYYTDDGDVLIQPIPTNQWSTYRAQIAAQAQTYYAAENVNLRVVDSDETVLQPYSTMQMNGVTRIIGEGGYMLGSVSAPLDVMNANPTQTGMLYYLGLKESLTAWYSNNNTNSIPLPPPNVTNDEQVRLWAYTAAHETGHALGLVAPGDLLGGDQGAHNQFPFNSFDLMNPGEESTLYQMMGREGVTWNFRTLNVDYLRFILPEQ